MNEWWRGAVIYQVYPRSFQDTDGDGVGDLAGVTQRLDHIASLGVDAVWISPFMKSPMDDYGYDVEDYRAVDPLFGSLEDFDALLEKTHRLGLKLLVDLVPCHTSDRHAWFREARQSRDNAKADWYVFAEPKEDGTPPNNWLSVFGGAAWTFEPRRGQYYLHNFLASQPQLNWHNPEVRDAMLAEAEFWLERGVDGFRVDAIDFALHDAELRDNPPRPLDRMITGGMASGSPYSRQLHRYQKAHPDLSEKVLQPLNQRAARHGGALLLGEISGDEALKRAESYTAGGGLDLAYTFDLLSCEPNAAGVRTVVETLESEMHLGWPCWSFSNHDVRRAISRFGEPENAAALQPVLTALLCCLRGTICLYQGDELGLTEAELAFADLRDPFGIAFYPNFKGRDGCRTPMPWEAKERQAGFTSGKPWLPIPDDHLERAVDLQKGDPHSVLERSRTFLVWRRTQPVLQRGNLAIVDHTDSTLTLTRSLDEETLVAAFNLGPDTEVIALPGAAEPLEGHGFTSTCDGLSVALPGYGAFFGRLER